VAPHRNQKNAPDRRFISTVNHAIRFRRAIPAIATSPGIAVRVAEETGDFDNAHKERAALMKGI
jgi:hypothetical protein